MKKVVLSALAVMMFAFANAQDVKYGVKGGLNLSNFSGDTDGINLKSKAGFNIGGFVEIKLSDKFFIQPELLYSTQGPKVKDQAGEVDGILYNGDVRFNLSYINVPVMFKYYVADKLNVEAGPQIGFLTSAKTKTTIDGYSGSHTMDVKDIFESIDFGLNFGVGYDFTDHLFGGLRYNFGIANIAKTEAGDNTKLHNGVFSINVGYKF
ncbi:porin family protein [Flavobacterium sharifuzzamanii]|uniref:porin family protein n=1 Tax=Flavobacterium sharifuzzamanii TaxID=2211133 RepID=UPI000DABF680|nr:porin family protein [Flavobacterium sharifuzzamanii]KAF2081343.1 PorT family protein [Flavobacterium sharifuzzamanii]